MTTPEYILSNPLAAQSVDAPKPEPAVWFHDVLRADGTPFSTAEVEFLRQFTKGTSTSQ